MEVLTEKSKELYLQQEENEYIKNKERRQFKQINIESKTKQKYSISGTMISLLAMLIIFVFYNYKKSKQLETFPFKRYNQHLKGQVFGNFSELYLKWDQSNMSQISNLTEKPFYHDRIQVGSVLDFGLTKSIDFQKLEKQLQQKIAYQLFYFEFDDSLQRQNSLIDRKFSDEQMQQFLYELASNPENKQKTIEYNLAIQLIKKGDNPKILQAEYYFANQKYNIEDIEQQIPICIYSSGFNILKNKYRFIQYFRSVQNLNYTNFHIVFVDDFSDDGSFEQVYNYIKNSSLRIRNKIKFVHNLQRIGIVGNMNFWIRNYCRSPDIVIILDADDKIIGRQALKILNSIYQSPGIWYAYSKFLITRSEEKYFIKGLVSTFFTYRTQQYRISFDWQTSHMRTFRKKLLDSIPISSLIQYQYQKELGVIWPRFYSSAGDMFFVHAQLQMAGNHRIAHIQEYFYLYYLETNTNEDCHEKVQMHNGDKSKIKTPLKIINKFGKTGKPIANYNISQDKIKRVQQSFSNWMKCEQKFKQKSPKHV